MAVRFVFASVKQADTLLAWVTILQKHVEFLRSPPCRGQMKTFDRVGNKERQKGGELVVCGRDLRT